MPSARQLVVAVIASYNGKADTLACLASLGEQDHEPLHTIVVDNGSTDGTVEAVREQFPDAEILEPGDNLGVAGAYRAGLQRARELDADHGLVLNNDTYFDPQMISALVAEAERRPDAGGFCPLIYFADPPDAVWYGGSTWSARLPYNGTMKGMRDRDVGQYATVTEEDHLTGAVMLAPRAALERTEPGPDPAIFYLFEDVEWSLRLRRAGFRLYLAPQAKAWHRVSVAHGGEYSPALAYYGTRNNLEVSARFAGRTGPRNRFRQGATFAVHLFHARRGSDKLGNVRATFEGLRDFRAGRLGRRGG